MPRGGNSRGYLTILVAALLGCTMADEDRCPPGTEYVTSGKYCRDIDTGGDGDTDTDSDADADAGDAADGSATDGPPSGMGETCMVDDDCEGYEADYCGIDPLSGSGICTVLDCNPGECPDGYQCCDCTQSTLVPQEVACIPDDLAGLAATAANCTCH